MSPLSIVILPQLPISHQSHIITEMPSRIPQPAFLPALPLSRTTALTRMTPIPLKRAKSARATSQTRRPFYASAETSDIHDSWRVYSKPGNNCVICCGNGSTKCLYCFGEGVVTVGPEAGRDTLTCPHCEGRGVETCVRCDGSGIRPDTRMNEDGTVVRNLTNDEVSLLPLEDYGNDEIAENPQRKTERETERETASASNGVAT